MKNYNTFDFQQYTEPTGAAPHNPKVVKKRKPVDEQQLLPLGEDVLSHNIGIPIIVVCTKTDTMLQLEKEYNYKEVHFDFIFQHIRRICIAYGASLIYVSAKKDRNCDVLLGLMKHKLYGFDFSVKPVFEKDVLFIPSGFDSMKKIQVDFQNQTLTRDPEDSFEDIIKVPKILIQSEDEKEAQISVEDDQDYLARHKANFAKEQPAGPPQQPGVFHPHTTEPSPPMKDNAPIPVTPSGAKDTDVYAEILARVMKDKPQQSTALPPVATRASNAPSRNTIVPAPIPPRNASPSLGNRDEMAKQLERLARGKTKE